MEEYVQYLKKLLLKKFLINVIKIIALILKKTPSTILDAAFVFSRMSFIIAIVMMEKLETHILSLWGKQ